MLAPTPPDDQKFLHFLDHSPDGMVIHCRGIVVYANPAILRWMGFGSADDAVGTSVMQWVHPDEHAEVVSRIRAAQESGIAAPPRQERFVRSDGQVLMFEVSSQPMVFRGAESIAVVVRDITQRVRAELEREAALEQVRKALKAQDDLLYVVSHDLRNPLAAIRSSADLIVRGPFDPSSAFMRAAQTIIRATARMDRLIVDLLDAGRIEAGRMSVSAQHERFSAVLEDALETLRPLAEQRRVSVARTGAPEVWSLKVQCDRMRVVQVLSNLIGNALHLAPVGSSVVIEGTREDALVRVKVCDEGPGVDPNELPQLFERFYRSPTSSYPGNGLGLFIAKGIVQAHGGSIGAENRVPRGCAFWFTLPLE